MNLLLLLIGSHAWKPAPALTRFARVFAAFSLLSIEMQLVTWLGIGSLHTLPLVNLVLAIAALAVWRPAPDRQPPAAKDRVWIAAVLLVGAVVVALNLGRQLEAADPYHLEKVERIERLGTLAYDPDTASKINVLSSVYEMLLADVRQIPAIGPLAIRLHGIWSLLLWLLAIGVARDLLRNVKAGDADPVAPAARWPWVALLVVPTVFHQLVLVKNDLFVAIPAFVALVWGVTRAGKARPREIGLVLWLAGLAVAIKLTTLPLLVVVGTAILIQRFTEWKAIAAAALGTFAGLLAGGLLFTLAMNVQVYGQLMPVEDIGSINPGVAAVMTGVLRFAISLVDLGRLTPVWWPGRGGWSGTFGLPFIWACGVLLWTSRRIPLARLTLLCVAVYFLAFAVVFPDADISHRLVLAPALLAIGVAVRVVDRGEGIRAWRIALVPVIALSTAQLARSTFLYFMR